MGGLADLFGIASADELVNKSHLATVSPIITRLLESVNSESLAKLSLARTSCPDNRE